jgi:hypothetical protein
VTWKPDPATFLSGSHGYVRRRARLPRRTADRLLDVSLRRVLARIDELPTPAGDVLVASVYRGDAPTLTRSLPQLHSSHHRVRFAFGAMGDKAPALSDHTVATGLSGGKFPNLNALVDDADWLVVVDDDVDLPARFLDRFLALCEHFDLALAQPAQTLASHAAWPHARRRARVLVRETLFVEIGPVTAFRRDAAAALTPFPDLRYGWGLDLAWSAVALERRWRLGIADAVAVRHEHGGVASAYSSQEAIREARDFLSTRPYLSATSAAQTLAVHRRL